MTKKEAATAALRGLFIANKATQEEREILEAEYGENGLVAVTACPEGLRENIEFCAENHDDCDAEWTLNSRSRELFTLALAAYDKGFNTQMAKEQYGFFQTIRQDIIEDCQQFRVEMAGIHPSVAQRVAAQFPVGSCVQLKNELFAIPRFIVPGDVALVTGHYVHEGFVHLNVVVTDRDCDVLMAGKLETWRVCPYLPE